MSVSDVPSPIDLRDTIDAKAWERSAQARLGRASIFERFRRELGSLRTRQPYILELGSGPGFLAEFLAKALPNLRLALLDFSAAMHDLAQARLREYSEVVEFIHGDFKDPNWIDRLGPFDAAVTNQSVHELRHKQHAVVLHRQVRDILKPRAPYLVADHFFGTGGMSDDQLYMTIAEHGEALRAAGFVDVRLLVSSGSLVMYRAE